MKYAIKTSKYFYQDKEEMEQLEKLGFTFEKTEYNSSVVCLETLKTKTVPDYLICENPVLEIDSIEELADFVKEYGQIVLDTDTIEIYNYYRE